jgi:capsular polysaccharide biosynthesis protein
VGFFLALFVSLGTAFGLGFMDNVVHSSADVARQLDVPVIVSIPDGEWPPNLLPDTMFETGSLPAESR